MRGHRIIRICSCCSRCCRCRGRFLRFAGGGLLGAVGGNVLKVFARLMVDLMTASCVLKPVGEISKVSRTVVALEGSHACVDIRMLFQLGVADEALITHSAGEGALLQMHQIVHLKAALCFVHFAALFTAVGTRLGMVLLVALQMGPLLESFLTLRAFVRLLGGVDPGVVRKIDLLDELLAADVTLVLLVVAMDLPMHPHTPQFEALATVGTLLPRILAALGAVSLKVFL